ncbi:MAG: hypothetical protein SFU87_11475 [Chitinophagaceae bacterium]|nr:hypothetical protein [Chitinophagaceae bacterium]
MVYKVIWSPLALHTYISNIEYLETAWTEREVRNFIASVKRRLLILSSQPQTRRITNLRKNIRKTVIHKRVILIYRVKPMKHEIELLYFFNTRRRPGRPPGLK